VARMYPAQLRPDTKSPAERKLYQALAAGLPNDFYVFHSVSWQVPDVRRGATDGEADFIVAHAQLGVLVIEVKGGQIRYPVRTGQWYSGEFPIQDPFEQAKTNKYSLLRLLKEHPFWKERWLSIGHTVAFPDIVVTQRLRLDAPREIVLDTRELTNLQSWVQAATAYWRGQAQAFESLGEQGVRLLVDLLSPSWDLQLRLGAIIQAEQEEIQRLTEEQFYILDLLGRTRRAAIGGCAGSGKTTLAVEKAIRLARQGTRVLLTCYNRFLAEYLARSLEPVSGVEVASFHKLALDWCRRAGLISDRVSFDSTFFTDTLPDMLVQAADRLGASYDALIVDESQDFHANWWLPLQCLLHDPDQGFLYAFYDDNQNLYRQEGIAAELAPFSLTRNLRNTRAIHRTVAQFYRSEAKPEAVGPEGRPVEIYTYTETAELKRLLKRTLHRLVVEEDIAPEDIVVLTPRSDQRSALWGLGSLGNFRLTDQWAAGAADIYCTTVHSFKGLESPVIILTEIDQEASADLARVLYVGCSRARSHLVILATDRDLLTTSITR